MPYDSHLSDWRVLIRMKDKLSYGRKSSEALELAPRRTTPYLLLRKAQNKSMRDLEGFDQERYNLRVREREVVKKLRSV